MSFKDLTKKLHDSLLEEEAPSTPVPAKPTTVPSFNFSNLPTAAGTATSPGFPPANSPFAVPSTVVLDETVYQRVFQKTDFDQTDVGRAVHKYYDALEGTGLDPNTRFKSALKQASALDGITPDRVLATFDSLKATLQGEGDKFARAVDGQTQKEVTGRQQHLQQIIDQIAQLNAQISDLQTQHTQVSAELVDAQQKVTNAQTQFQLATTRRSNEIDQQKAQFAGLLK